MLCSFITVDLWYMQEGYTGYRSFVIEHMGMQVHDPVRVVRIIQLPEVWISLHYSRWLRLKQKKAKGFRRLNRCWIYPLVVISFLAGIGVSALGAWLTKFSYIGLWGGMISGAANVAFYQYLADKYKL